MWQAILAAKDDLSAKVPKPSRKKRKTLPKPNPTSEYSLRKNPKKKFTAKFTFLFIFIYFWSSLFKIF